MQLIQKLRYDQKCMKKVEPSSRSKAIQDIINIGSFMEALVLNHYVLVRKIFGGALLWRRGVLLLMLTNKGCVDGNGSHLSGRFGNPGGGRETRRGGDGLEGPSGGATWDGVGDSLGDDEEV
nr:hypothetical protein [Tanacetum cinerariifolium]